jgi:hypothetical protein
VETATLKTGRLARFELFNLPNWPKTYPSRHVLNKMAELDRKLYQGINLLSEMIFPNESYEFTLINDT